MALGDSVNYRHPLLKLLRENSADIGARIAKTVARGETSESNGFLRAPGGGD